MTKCRLRALVGLLCAIIIATVGVGRSTACAPTADPPRVQGLSGTLTGTGQLTINDVPAQSGASIGNGSLVGAGPDGDASLDLGALGRIQLRPNTVVRVALSPGHCALEMVKCGSLTQVIPDGVSTQVRLTTAKLVQVATLRGAAKASFGSKSTTIKAGARKNIYNTSEVVANGNATFTINCCQCCFVEQKR
jgi:hypothetical protein